MRGGSWTRNRCRCQAEGQWPKAKGSRSLQKVGDQPADDCPHDLPLPVFSEDRRSLLRDPEPRPGATSLDVFDLSWAFGLGLWPDTAIRISVRASDRSVTRGSPAPIPR